MRGADSATSPVESWRIKLITVPNINRLTTIRQVVYMALTSCKVDMPNVESTVYMVVRLKRPTSRISAGDNATLGLVAVSKPVDGVGKNG